MHKFIQSIIYICIIVCIVVDRDSDFYLILMQNKFFLSIHKPYISDRIGIEATNSREGNEFVIIFEMGTFLYVSPLLFLPLVENNNKIVNLLAINTCICMHTFCTLNSVSKQ